MKSKTQNQIQPAQVSDDFIEQLYGIVDTKLQYIEFQIQAAFRHSTGPGENQQAIPSQSSLTEPTFLGHIERYSKDKKQLLLLRALIHKKNALDIYQLLHDNHFKNLNENDLKHLSDRIE